MTHKKVYVAILLSADGKKFTTDYMSNTKEEVLKKLTSDGNKQAKYPYAFIVEYDPSKPIKIREAIQFIRGDDE